MRSLPLARTLLLPIVRRALAPTLDRATCESLVDETLVSYTTRCPTAPPEPSAGGRLMVRLAALTVCFYRALLARGHDEAQARALTVRVTTAVYDKMATMPTVLSRMGSRSGKQRLARATSMFRRFPFSPPAYRMQDVPTDTEAVAFDVLRCPVAEYFAAEGLQQLCVESWCNLDFALARRWGGTLERSRTLAEGADHCDFRWVPADAVRVR